MLAFDIAAQYVQCNKWVLVLLMEILKLLNRRTASPKLSKTNDMDAD